MRRPLLSIAIVLSVFTIVVLSVDRLIFRQASPGSVPAASSGSAMLSLMINALPFILFSLVVLFALRSRMRARGAGAYASRGATAGGTLGGYVNADGTVAAGSGFSVAHDAPGTFTVRATNPGAGVGLPIMTATPWGTDTPVTFVTVQPLADGAPAPGFTVSVRDSGGQPIDAAFTFSIVQT